MHMTFNDICIATAIKGSLYCCSTVLCLQVHEDVEVLEMPVIGLHVCVHV